MRVKICYVHIKNSMIIQHTFFYVKTICLLIQQFPMIYIVATLVNTNYSLVIHFSIIISSLVLRYQLSTLFSYNFRLLVLVCYLFLFKSKVTLNFFIVLPTTFILRPFYQTDSLTDLYQCIYRQN